MKRLAVALTLTLLVASTLLLGIIPGQLEDSLNRTLPHPPHAISEAGAALHRVLRVMDWHTDTLLWKRDPLMRSERGHVDLVRLREGNVALQMFTIVSKSPAGQNYDQNTADTDMITLLAMAQAWPPRTWASLFARAEYQAQRLHDAARRSKGTLRVIEDRADLEALLAARRPGTTAPVGALLGIEGAHVLEGELENLDRLHALGVRMVGLQHFFDNRLGGSLHGQSRAGLTQFGRSVVRRAQSLGMLVDVAHSSPAVVDDVLAISRAPIVVSHTGLYGHCPTARNLRDEQMKRIAGAGGLIAIGYWDAAVCDVSPEGIVSALRYAGDLLGVDHVARGSDYDGTITAPFHTGELAVLTDRMLAAGFTRDEIAKVMGENAIALLGALLPGTTSP